MRILQVTPGYAPALGGVELHVQTMSEALVSCGHEVVVATMTKDRTLPRREVIGGVEVRRFSAFGPDAYKCPIGLFSYLQNHKHHFDIVHAHNYHALPLLQTALACRKRAIITPHYHGHGHTRFADILHRVYNIFAMTAVRRTGGIVCVSSSEADLVANHFQINRSKIAVIPNITTVSNINYEVVVGRKPKISDQGYFILSVGRLDTYKRVDRVIAAMPYLPTEIKLVVIGIGPERANLEKMSIDLGVHDRVHFLGRVSDKELQLWYQQTDIVVSLSTSEAFGRTIIEALAAGCFVVCSDIPVFRDFINDFSNAVTLTPIDILDIDLAVLIYTILANDNCQRVSLHRYTPHEVLKELHVAYENIITSN